MRIKENRSNKRYFALALMHVARMCESQRNIPISFMIEMKNSLIIIFYKKIKIDTSHFLLKTKVLSLTKAERCRPAKGLFPTMVLFRESKVRVMQFYFSVMVKLRNN